MRTESPYKRLVGSPATVSVAAQTLSRADASCGKDFIQLNASPAEDRLDCDGGSLESSNRGAGMSPSVCVADDGSLESSNIGAGMSPSDCVADDRSGSVHPLGPQVVSLISKYNVISSLFCLKDS